MAAALKGNGPHPPFCLSLRHPAFIRIFADVSKRGECEPGQTGHREEQLLLCEITWSTATVLLKRKWKNEPFIMEQIHNIQDRFKLARDAIMISLMIHFLQS